MSDHKYTIHLTERQARVIVDALDLFSRIGMGQLKEVAYVLRQNPLPSYDPDLEIRTNLLFKIRDKLDILARYWMKGPGYYGITSKSISDKFRIAWDIQQVVRHRLAWDRNPKGDITIDFDNPMKTSEEDLPKIEVEK
jgi:hypothetical protein